jgi:hypothetical protein
MTKVARYPWLVIAAMSFEPFRICFRQSAANASNRSTVTVSSMLLANLSARALAL